MEPAADGSPVEPSVATAAVRKVPISGGGGGFQASVSNLTLQ